MTLQFGNFMNTRLSIIKMVFITIIVTGVTMISGCKSEKAFELSLSAEPSYKINSAILVTLSVTNKSPIDVQFLKWGTPFESMPTRDMFSVKDANGQTLSYQGPMVKRGKPEASDYVTIKSGQTLKQAMDISKAYDIRASGTYHVQYKESYPSLKDNVLEKDGGLTLPATNSVSFQVVD